MNGSEGGVLEMAPDDWHTANEKLGKESYVLGVVRGLGLRIWLQIGASTSGYGSGAAHQSSGQAPGHLDRR